MRVCGGRAVDQAKRHVRIVQYHGHADDALQDFALKGKRPEAVMQ
jgi:hypothetical protein